MEDNRQAGHNRNQVNHWLRDMKMSRPKPNLFIALAVAAFLLLACFSMNGQTTVRSTTPGLETFSIAPNKPLRSGVDAWPAIVAPITPAAHRVNETLAALNRKIVIALRECDANYRDWDTANSTDNPAGKVKSKRKVTGEWQRKITVTMSGPRFVSLVASDSQFCGGAYPNNDRTALVFDMTTGKPVDWNAFLTESTDADAASFVSYDGFASSGLNMPALTDVAVSKAVEDCKKPLADDRTFLVWPDAKRGELIVVGVGLPHGAQACEEEIPLTIDQARKLGFRAEFLENLERAHRTAQPRR